MRKSSDKSSSTTVSTPFSSDEQAFRLAHEYAWNWFSYHAGQRISLFNFGIIAIGALTAACYSSFSQNWYSAAALSAALAAFLALVFLRLDQRNSELTKIAEQYLKLGTEKVLSPIVGEEIKLSSRADEPKRDHFHTFGQIVKSVYRLAIICATGAAAAAVYLNLYN